MFFQTVLQSLLKKKKKGGSIQDKDLNKKQPSPLVQRILMEMRKHSAAKKSETATDKDSPDQKPK
jgi:hypothetical protein